MLNSKWLHIIFTEAWQKKILWKIPCQHLNILLKKKCGIETDLQVTQDNQLICFHDFNLRRRFNLNKNIKDINYSTLKKMSNKRKAPVPKLEDLLRISRNKYPLLLEIKPLLTKHSLLNLIPSYVFSYLSSQLYYLRLLDPCPSKL